MAGGRPIRIAILANGRQARAEIDRTASTLTTIGTKASKVGKLIGLGLGGAAVARAGAAFVRSGAGYVTSLNKIQVLTSSTDAQMKRAAATIEANSGRYAKMGQTTSDAAFGITELAKSGLSLHKSLSAVNATMVLAKAGEMDVADASEVVANTLNTFHLRASKAADIANYLANAANISSADVSDLAESLKYVAPMAAKSGVSLAQTSALLAELANNGIKGSQAGTSLRQMLIRLQAPSKQAQGTLDDIGVSIFDADGKMRPFGKIIDDLGRKIGKLNGADRARALKNLFGVNASTAAQVILKNGVKTLDSYTRGVKQAGAAQRLANTQSKGLMGTLAKIRANATSAGQSFYRKYSPAVDQALQKTMKFAGSAADAIRSTPTDVKRLAVEVGIAALAFPRLAAGLATAKAAIVDQITYLRVLKLEYQTTGIQTRTTAAAMARLGAIAKTAAGVGGMAALADGAHRANGATKILETTLGAAVTGGAMAGPWGIVAGALAGGGFSLVSALRSARSASDRMNTAMKNSADAASGARPTIADYAGTLDKITGAATRATKASILQKLQQDGIVQQAAVVGLSAKTLVAATLGQADALKIVNNAWKTHQDVLSLSNLSSITTWIHNQNNAFEDQRSQIRETSKTLSKFTHKDAKDAQKALKGVGDAKVDDASWLESMRATFGKGHKIAATGAKGMQGDLAKSGHAKIDAGPFYDAIRNANRRARGIASSGATSVGGALSSGVKKGIGGLDGWLSGTLGGIINNAITAAKHAAKSNSPSKRTMQLGNDLGDGLVIGVNARRRKAVKAMSGIVKDMLASAGRGEGSLDSILRRYLNNHTKLTAKYVTETLKGHNKIKHALIKEASQIDKVTKKYKGQNYTLAKANQLLKDRKQALRDYITTVKSAIIATGDLTQMSIPFTGAGIIAGLTKSVDKAKQFFALLKRLKGAGLNKTTLQQLIDAGPEGGLAIAQALADGIGTGLIKQVNGLVKQLTGVAGDTADTMGHFMKDAGITAAQSLVDGIKKKRAPLIKQFKDLADELINELIKKAKSEAKKQKKAQKKAKGKKPRGKKKRSSPKPKTRTRVSARAAFAGADSTTSTTNHYTINIHVPPGANKAQIGKELVSYINAYERAGGRKTRL